MVAVESPGIELLCRELASSRKSFRIGFFLEIKRTDACLFVYRSAIRDEFLLLLAVLEGHVGSKQAIDQFAFLVLGPKAGKSNQE